MLPEPDVIEATVPCKVSVGDRAPEWLTLYRRDLDAAAITTARTMRVVNPQRTLLDCIAVMDGDELDRLVDSQLGRMINEGVVIETLAANKGMWGAPAARRQLREAAIGADSEPERLLGRALARRGYQIRGNLRLGRYYPDFYDEKSNTVIEVDGREAHSQRLMFRKDRRRQNDLVNGRRHVLRYAADDVIDDIDDVADEVVALIRRRRRNR
jgi:very-short-patch-repair endonuclease